MTANERYEVVIIGTGAGGGTLAYPFYFGEKDYPFPMAISSPSAPSLRDDEGRRAPAVMGRALLSEHVATARNCLRIPHQSYRRR